MTRHLPFRLTVVLVALAVPLLSSAQPGSRQTAGAARVTQPSRAASPAPASPGPAAKSSGAAAPEADTAQVPYTYRAAGRRDPFVSLWAPSKGGPRERSGVEGLAGLYTSDLRVKGILQSGGHFVAIVVGSDGKRQYIVHQNDRLADGVVKAITADSVVILQEVGDPLSLARQREIRKTLRAVEEVQ
jgi:Tfp pilus assembly protein PilP